MNTEVTPIVRDYGAAAQQKRITTILLHPLAVQLNATDRRVLKKVAAYERRTEGCRLSQRKIGQQVALSREQVNRVLGKLDRCGFILREQERRANGSVTTCKITLNDALIRQVLGLESVSGCHTVKRSEGTTSVVSVGEKRHTATSHGMSHLEVEAKASPVGSRSLDLRQEAKNVQGATSDASKAAASKGFTPPRLIADCATLAVTLEESQLPAHASSILHAARCRLNAWHVRHPLSLAYLRAFSRERERSRGRSGVNAKSCF